MMQDWLLPYPATISAMGIMGDHSYFLFRADWKLPRSGAFLVAFLALVGMLVVGAAAALR
jgi:hypothetical protein